MSNKKILYPSAILVLLSSIFICSVGLSSCIHSLLFIKEWITINFFYVITLLIIFYLPIFYIKNQGSYSEKSMFLSIFLFFIILGVYIVLFHIPNFVLPIAKLCSGYSIHDVYLELILSIVVWFGFSLILSSIDKILHSMKDKKTSFKRIYWEVVCFFYIIYINSILALINPIFNR